MDTSTDETIQFVLPIIYTALILMPFANFDFIKRMLYKREKCYKTTNILLYVENISQTNNPYYVNSQYNLHMYVNKEHLKCMQDSSSFEFDQENDDDKINSINLTFSLKEQDNVFDRLKHFLKCVQYEFNLDKIYVVNLNSDPSIDRFLSTSDELSLKLVDLNTLYGYIFPNVREIDLLFNKTAMMLSNDDNEFRMLPSELENDISDTIVHSSEIDDDIKEEIGETLNETYMKFKVLCNVFMCIQTTCTEDIVNVIETI